MDNKSKELPVIYSNPLGKLLTKPRNNRFTNEWPKHYPTCNFQFSSPEHWSMSFIGTDYHLRPLNVLKWKCKRTNQCCPTEIFKNRQFELWNLPKSPFLEPKIAEISPHFQQIFTTFCPGWPFLLRFYVTMFSKIEICKIFLLLFQENFPKIFQFETLKNVKILWLLKCQARLKYRRNCQNFTWNRGKIAENWQYLKIAENFAKIACDFCKNLIATLPSKIAELAINRGVWQHWSAISGCSL